MIETNKSQPSAKQIRKYYTIMLVGMIFGIICGIPVLVFMLSDQPAQVRNIALTIFVTFDIFLVICVIWQRNKRIKNSQE